jgi:hypothetical protein
LGVFPFSSAENFLGGAMDTLARWRGERKEEGMGSKEMEMSKGLCPSSFIARGRQAVGLHGRR